MRLSIRWQKNIETPSADPSRRNWYILTGGKFRVLHIASVDSLVGLLDHPSPLVWLMNFSCNGCRDARLLLGHTAHWYCTSPKSLKLCLIAHLSSTCIIFLPLQSLKILSIFRWKENQGPRAHSVCTLTTRHCLSMIIITIYIIFIINVILFITIIILIIVADFVIVIIVCCCCCCYGHFNINNLPHHQS